MGKLKDRIDKASPNRLVEITEDLLKVKCDKQCSSEKEDVKDAKMSLKDYLSGIKAQLIAYGVIGAGAGAVLGWKEVLGKLMTLGIYGAIAITIGGLLVIWWLYEVYSQIAKRVKELRKATNALDDCLTEHNCH